MLRSLIFGATLGWADAGWIEEKAEWMLLKRPTTRDPRKRPPERPHVLHDSLGHMQSWGHAQTGTLLTPGACMVVGYNPQCAGRPRSHSHWHNPA